MSNALLAYIVAIILLTMLVPAYVGYYAARKNWKTWHLVMFLIGYITALSFLNALADTIIHIHS